MTSVEKILAVLKHRKIPVSRLERDLGYGNGYIRQLKKGSIPAGRLMQICNYFDIPFSDMLPSDAPFDPAGFDKKNTVTPQGDGDIRFALYGDAAEDVTDEDIRAIREYAEFIRNRRKQ